MPSVRRFTARGTKRFRKYFHGRVDGAPQAVPEELLNGLVTTEPLSYAREIESRLFESRYQFGCYLVEVLQDCPSEMISEDDGLWNWLTAFYFESLFPSPRGAKEESRYIFRSNDRLKWYRHLVRTNWDLVRTHGDTARVVLSGAINELGDEIEQLISRQDFRANRPLLDAAKLLFFVEDDDGQGRLARGARDKDPAVGTLRRFITITQQLLLTHDIYAMSPKEILGLLPGEFDRWKPDSPNE